MAYHGLNCHAVPTFVTDGPGETYCSFAYDSGAGTITRGGITFNLEGGFDGRDRDNLVDRRLAAILATPNNIAPKYLNITLTEGPGTYKVWIALGDEGFLSIDQRMVISDGPGGTVLKTLTGSTTTGRRWFDANNVVRTLETWPQYAKGGVNEADGAALLTFTGTSMYILLGSATGTSTTTLAHIGWEKVAASGPTINTQPANQTVASGATFTFSVVATASAGTLTYQWRKNGFNISGATGASYTGVAGIDGVSGDVFDCQVNDTNGSVTTTNAVLTVISGARAGFNYYYRKGNSNV